MENLIRYIQSRISLKQSEINLLKRYLLYEEIPARTTIIKAGKVENYVYFLEKGIVKGFQNIDGKIVVQHLVAEQDFFTALESFTTQTPSIDSFESITECKFMKISKSHFDILQKETKFWAILVEEITNAHLSCKLERVKDFQVLTAKERYLKFVKQHPKLAQHVSIDNVASFLGIEPQSLSRIRKQIVF